MRPFSLRFDRDALVVFGVFFLCVCLFLLDGLDKANRLGYVGGVGYILRGLLLVFCFGVCLLRPSSIFGNAFLFFCFLCMAWLFGLLFSGVDYNSDFFRVLYVSMRYLGALFVLLVFVFVVPLSKNYSLMFNGLFLVNCVLAWVGLFFDLQVFRTYGHIRGDGWVDSRFGFDGLLPEQNVATFFYLFGFVNLYWLFFVGRVRFIWLVFGFFSCFIVGTKSLMFCTLFFLLFVVCRRVVSRFFVMLFFIGLFVCALFYFGLSDLFVFELWDWVLSFRLSHFVEKIPPLLDHFGILQYLFGVQGADNLIYLVELEFVDLFVFFGVVGAFFYVVTFFNSSIWLFRAPMGKELFALLVFIAAFSGHLFYDPATMLYYAVLVLSAKSGWGGGERHDCKS